MVVAVVELCLADEDEALSVPLSSALSVVSSVLLDVFLALDCAVVLFFLADELLASVVSLELLELSSELLSSELESELDESLLLLSLLLSSELDLSSDCFLSLLLVLPLMVDDCTTLELVAEAPLTVWVVLFTTTLVAPNARTIDTIANGDINGGVR